MPMVTTLVGGETTTPSRAPVLVLSTAAYPATRPPLERTHLKTLLFQSRAAEVRWYAQESE